MRETVALAWTSDRRHGIEVLFRLLDPDLFGFDRVWIRPDIQTDLEAPESSSPDLLYQIVMEIKQRTPLPITIVERNKRAWRRWGLPRLVHELGVETLDLEALPDDRWESASEGLKLPSEVLDEGTLLISTSSLSARDPGDLAVSLLHLLSLEQDAKDLDLPTLPERIGKLKSRLCQTLVIVDAVESRYPRRQGLRGPDDIYRTQTLFAGWDAAAVDSVALAFLMSHDPGLDFSGKSPLEHPLLRAAVESKTTIETSDDIELKTDGSSEELVGPIRRGLEV